MLLTLWTELQYNATKFRYGWSVVDEICHTWTGWRRQCSYGLWSVLRRYCFTWLLIMWAAKKPLRAGSLSAPTYFCNPRPQLRDLPLHAPLHRFFCNARSPLRSTRFSARFAPTMKLRPRTNGGQINHAIYR